MKKGLITDAYSEYCVFFSIDDKIEEPEAEEMETLMLVGRSESWDCLGKTEV